MESSALRGSVRPEFPPPRQSDVLNSGQRSSTERNPRLVTPPLVTGGSHRSACRSPMSPESFGIETVDHSVRDPFEAADHMVDEMTAALLETAMSTSPQSDPVRGHLMRDSIGMQTQEELVSELTRLRGELEIQGMKLEDRSCVSQQRFDGLTHQLGSMAQQITDANADAETAQSELLAHMNRCTQLENELSLCQEELASSRELSLHVETEGSRVISADTVRTLEEECASLRDRLSSMDRGREIQQELVNHILKQPSDIGKSEEEQPLLATAYKQISSLNTQLAHLYTELTLSRTEVQRLRADPKAEKSVSMAEASTSECVMKKQNAQIADLVGDIRHLQLDLEYHQQKLDQMIKEKQQMMTDFRKCQVELRDARQQLEERDQMLKHKDVDLIQLKELQSPGREASASGGADTLAALRMEAASKDSALIVSHYELHKEKLLRERLEKKNALLVERMQKLMMVVETMRRENGALERNILNKEQIHEDKERQLQHVTHKAKYLQRLMKAPKTCRKEQRQLELDMSADGPRQGLPPLDNAQGRSGQSTPRTLAKHPPFCVR